MKRVLIAQRGGEKGTRLIAKILWRGIRDLSRFTSETQCTILRYDTTYFTMFAFLQSLGEGLNDRELSEVC